MKKSKIFAVTLFFLLILAVFAATSVIAEPGGEDDPVISLSYIENKLIPELKAYIDGKIAEIRGSGESMQASAFEVVEMKKGQKLVGGAGCELILRMGAAVIVATEKGGIADTTAGYDLADSSEMPSNHLLIVPLDDGRGFVAATDVIVMVKGTYTIQ